RTTFLFDQDLGHHSALIKFSPVGAVASAEESSYSERWIRLQYQITRIPPDDVIAVSGIAFDLTEDVYTAKNKQNTARLLSTILDTAPQLIFVKNSERQFVFANKALTEFLGKAEGHLLNKRDEDAFTIPHDASPELKSAYSHQLARFARSDAEVLAGYAISPAEETIIPPNSYLHHARVFHTVKREISFDGKDCILGIAT